MWPLLRTWVEQGGIAAVFLLMAVESCGVPFPSEVIMPVAGALAAGGHLNFAGVVGAGALGNLVGSVAAYALAARYGTPLLLGPGRRIGISASHLEMSRHWFDRYGLFAVFAGRILPVVRTYISFPAGLARVEPVRFSILTLLGAIPWCIALTAAGYAVGANFDRVRDTVSGPIEKFAIVMAIVVAGVVVAWFVRGRRSVAGGRNPE